MSRVSSVVVLALSLCVTAYAQDSLLFLVRHAERDASGGDAALLNHAGEQRAQCLAKTLELAGITQIYVTEIKRTQETAAPLAQELHIQPKIVPRADVAKLVADLRAAKNARVLVVGHADTLPKITEELGAGTLPESRSNEQDYDHLIVIPMHAGKAQRLTVIRYCPASIGD